MSTRATYRIKEIGTKEYIKYFYIHYDGYPEGAAEYFKEMLKNYELISDRSSHDNSVRKRMGKTITAFGMLCHAEYTEDHESHGDTEYRYNIYHDLKDGAWWVTCDKHIYNGKLEDFIEKYGKA